jgi:hypothetical protein
MSDQRLSVRTPKPEMHRRHFARNFFATSDGPNVRARTEGKRRSIRPRVETFDGGTSGPRYGQRRYTVLQSALPKLSALQGWGKQRKRTMERGPEFLGLN